MTENRAHIVLSSMGRSAYLKSIGSAIRARRRALGLNQATLARAVGVKRDVIRSVELGQHDPTLDLLIALAARLRLSVAELLARAEKL